MIYKCTIKSTKHCIARFSGEVAGETVRFGFFSLNYFNQILRLLNYTKYIFTILTTLNIPVNRVKTSYAMLNYIFCIQIIKMHGHT